MPLFRRKSEKQASNSQNAPPGSRIPRSASNDSGLSASSWNGQPPHQRPQTLLLSDSGLLQNSNIPPEALESPIRTTSHLSKTLQEVLKDKDALSCFIAFMRSQKADHLIQFWCDAQSFQATTLMRVHTHALKNVSKSTMLKRRSGSLVKSADSSSEETVNITALENGAELADSDDSTSNNKQSQSAFTPHESAASCESFTLGSSSSSPGPTVQDQPSPSVSQANTLSGQSESEVASVVSRQPCDNKLVPPPSQSLPTLQSQLQSQSSPYQPSLQSNQSAATPVTSSSSHGGDSGLASPQCEADRSHFSGDGRCSRDNSSRSEKSSSCDRISDDVSPAKSFTSAPSSTTPFADGADELISANGSGDSCDSRAQGEGSQREGSQDDRLSQPEGEQTEAGHLTSADTPAEDVAAKLRKSVERDAVTIFSNYIAKDAPRPVGVDDQLRADTISKICLEDGNVDPECFQQCQEFVLRKIQANHFQSFKDSEYHCRHLVNVLTSGQVYLPDVLLAENALCYFMEYMEQEGASDFMQLWLVLENFQQQLTSAPANYDWEQAQSDAMVIYDKYFSLQATHPMGFDDKTRFEVEENICREGGPLPNCFSKAKVIVLRTLDKIHFSHYLKSQVFHRYLSDLVTTVQMSEDLQNKNFTKGHRRNASDASSEHSISSQSTTGTDQSKPRNTLLAVDTRKVKKGASNSSSLDGDFSMSLEMFNPDELWKRTSPGGMSLGSVDELGQFVSCFESDTVTDKKKGAGFLKRWKEKEKEQEEMALQVAQMIIKDVNSMTRPQDSVKGDNNAGKDESGS